MDRIIIWMSATIHQSKKMGKNGQVCVLIGLRNDDRFNTLSHEEYND